MSEIFDSIQVSDEAKRFVDHSFDVADQIHEILERQGKTQRDLASMLGKKESEISKWMRGTHNFTLKSIAKIEAVLNEKIIVTSSKAKSLSEPKMVLVSATINKKVTQPDHEVFDWKYGNAERIFEGGLKTA